MLLFPLLLKLRNIQEVEHVLSGDDGTFLGRVFAILDAACKYGHIWCSKSGPQAEEVAPAVLGNKKQVQNFCECIETIQGDDAPLVKQLFVLLVISNLLLFVLLVVVIVGA